jgi:FtsZ-binding cell division protein ZapB
MVSIEQVRLLESRVIKAIDYVDLVNEENTLLKGKLGDCQKRIEELEVLIQRFKEDQSKIEDGILSALDRLNKFEDDMDRGISNAKADVGSRRLPPEERHIVQEARAVPDLDEDDALPAEPEKDGSPDLGIF